MKNINDKSRIKYLLCIYLYMQLVVLCFFSLNSLATENNENNKETQIIVNKEELKNSKIINSTDNTNTSQIKCIKYLIQEDESLITILRNHNYYPIYGKNGYLVKTIQLNPNITQKISFSLKENIFAFKRKKMKIIKIYLLKTHFNPFT